MFSSNTNKQRTRTEISTVQVKNGVPSIISSDLSILGNLISEGAIEVEGRIEGNMTCSQATIHKTGFIKGDIIAESVHINGEVRGLIKARHVRLSENGKVIGVIMYETLSIEDGAFVDGQCKNTDKLHRVEIGANLANAFDGDEDANEDIRLIEQPA